MANEKTHRIFGLDLLRCIALFIVVKRHCRPILDSFIPVYSDIKFLDPVDVFFVLSGYLIGLQLIKLIEEKQTFNFSLVSLFLKRRWLRTLPNYFLFLGINIVLIYNGLIKGEINKFLITYFVFFQNFFKPYDFLYWESWSLSIEEWFYLFFPLILLFLFIIKPSFLKVKNLILFSILIFIIFSIIYRFYYLKFNVTGAYWDLYVRKLVVTRFDSIGLGLIGAYIKYYYSYFWLKWKNISFFIGSLFLLILSFNYIPPEKLNFLLQLFYYPILSLSILLLLPKLESLKNENIPYKPFEFVSKISFSIYLIHVPLIQIFTNNIQYTGTIESLFVFFLYWGILLSLSYLVYNYFEKPFMNMRKNI